MMSNSIGIQDALDILSELGDGVAIRRRCQIEEVLPFSFMRRAGSRREKPREDAREGVVQVF